MRCCGTGLPTRPRNLHKHPRAADCRPYLPHDLCYTVGARLARPSRGHLHTYGGRCRDMRPRLSAKFAQTSAGGRLPPLPRESYCAVGRGNPPVIFSSLCDSKMPAPFNKGAKGHSVDFNCAVGDGALTSRGHPHTYGGRCRDRRPRLSAKSAQMSAGGRLPPLRFFLLYFSLPRLTFNGVCCTIRIYTIWSKTVYKLYIQRLILQKYYFPNTTPFLSR